MNIEIPKIVRPLPLSDYAPEFGDVHLDVWVNPSRKLLEAINQVAHQVVTTGLTPENAEESIEVIAQIWSCTPEEVSALIEHSADTDPKLFQWLLVRTFKMIRDHRLAVKKN